MKRNKTIWRKVREGFVQSLDTEFFKQFQVKLETEYSILTMSLHSTRADGKKLTRKQWDWIAAYSSGYEAANQRVPQ